MLFLLVRIRRINRYRQGYQRIRLLARDAVREDMVRFSGCQGLSLPIKGLTRADDLRLRAVLNKLVAYRQIEVCRTIAAVLVIGMVLVVTARAVCLAVPVVGLAREEELRLSAACLGVKSEGARYRTVAAVDGLKVFGVRSRLRVGRAFPFVLLALAADNLFVRYIVGRVNGQV